MTESLASCDLVAFVGVADLDRAREFYVDTLGLQLVEQNPAALVIDSNGTTLRVTLVPAPQQAGGALVAWFKDPDDNVLSLMQLV